MGKNCFNCPCVMEDCYRPRCITADGVPRLVLVANRSLPGPSIEVCHHDQIVVDVMNRAEDGEGISIHWHGLFQRGSPFMDGVGMVTQCPIVPHTKFRYNFTADNVGTYWWHGHTGMHRSEGFFGSLIIRQADQVNKHSHLYDFDLSRHVIQFNDWYHRSTLDIFVSEYLAGIAYIPDSVLINGKAQLAVFMNETEEHHMKTYMTPREVFSVEKGYRYRFRVINAAATRAGTMLSIDNHTLTVIATDGHDVEPVEVDAIMMYPGERYDFILHASQEVGNYWLKIYPPKEDLIDHQGLAIVRYEGAGLENPSADPKIVREGFIMQPVQSFDSSEEEEGVACNELVSMEEMDIPQDNVRKIYLAYDVRMTMDPRYGVYAYNPQLNNRTFIFQNYSLLSQFDDDKNADDICMLTDAAYIEDCQEEICLCTQVVQIDLNQTIELILIDVSNGYPVEHPMHIHGYAFRLLAMEKVQFGLTIDKVVQLDQDGEIKRNYNRPPIKDTLLVPSGGYAVVQFLADNPGWWYLHCHIEFHNVNGQAVILRVGNQQDFPTMPDNFPVCGDYVEPIFFSDLAHDKYSREMVTATDGSKGPASNHTVPDAMTTGSAGDAHTALLRAQNAVIALSVCVVILIFVLAADIICRSTARRSLRDYHNLDHELDKLKPST